MIKLIWGLYPNISTRYPLSIHIDIDNAGKMAKLNFSLKVTKNNLRIISKPHAYLQTINKTLLKFQKNQYKTVGGVASTRYPLSLHIVKENAWKMAKFNFQKKWQK